MEPLVFLILHTFNIENQNNIVAQNENILKHSSSSSCKDLDINEKWKSSVNPNFNKNRFSIYIHFISLNWSKRNKCLSDIWNITSCCYFVHVNRPIALAKWTKRWINKENERLHFFMSNVFVPTGLHKTNTNKWYLFIQCRLKTEDRLHCHCLDITFKIQHMKGNMRV